MSVFDEVMALSGVISEGQPAGPDVEYESDYSVLNDIVTPPKVGMIAVDASGDQNDVNWQEGKSLALKLASQTRDLRIAVRLCRCLTETDGVEGLCAAIGLIKALIADMWVDLHPQLDSDDNMDLTFRFNSLAMMSAPDFIARLDTICVAKTKLGDVASLHTIELSSGKRVSDSADERTQATGIVSDAFSHEPIENLSQRKAIIDQAVKDLRDIPQIWSEHVAVLGAERLENGLAFDAGVPPQFNELATKLSNMSRYMAERLPELDTSEESLADGNTGSKLARGGIVTRDDAGRELDKIVEWFRKNEPSSPVPMMLERAKMMISRSFLDIVSELGDSGLNEVRKAAGQDGARGSEDEYD